MILILLLEILLEAANLLELLLSNKTGWGLFMIDYYKFYSICYYIMF